MRRMLRRSPRRLDGTLPEEVDGSNGNSHVANPDISTLKLEGDDSAPSGAPSPMTSPEVFTLPNFKRMEASFQDDYDTDDEAPPVYNMEAEDFEEEALDDTPEEEGEKTKANAPAIAQFISISAADINKLTIPGLKHELMIRAVRYTSSLKKPELKARLLLALKNGVKVTVFGDQSKVAVTDTTGFAPGSHWLPLVLNKEAVEDPANTMVNASGPTVPRDEADTVPIKHNFSESFDRPIFQGRQCKPRYDESGNKITDNGAPQELVIRKKLAARRDFQIRHSLSQCSDPVEFADAFFPWNPNVYGPKFLSMHQLTAYTNMKAQFSNAGDNYGRYPDYKPFSVKEVRQFLGLQIWQGLNPSPRIEMKLRSANEDPLQGNQYLYQHIGINGVRRFKEFRAFFSGENPLVFPPSKKKSPLFKVYNVIKWINHVGPQSVDCGESISINEQTIGFQGKHSDNHGFSYKREGDGFQCDAICQEGFTYQVYFRNEPPLVQYTSKGISPLHARCLWLFDSLKEKHHRCWMDNLYLSAKFAKACYMHPMKVLIAGVTRKNGRGLPKHVLQEEVKNKKAQMAVRGTVKAAVLCGDKDCPALVASSVYDTEPIHFLSMICESIKWVPKSRLVYNPAEEKMVPRAFLMWNMNSDCNVDMGHVEVADQLHGNYRMDHCVSHYKWWWSIWLWGFDVLLVNAYVYYKKVMEEAGVPKKEWLTDYEFRRAIALAWVQSDEPTIEDRRKINLPATVTVLKKRKVAPLDSGRRKRRRKSHGENGSVETPPSTDDMSSITTDSTSKKKRDTTISDNSLVAITGPFCRRLDLTVGHWCVEVPNRAKCLLHLWASGLEETANVFSCSFCCVTLCAYCFKVFHTEKSEDLLKNKDFYKDHFLAKLAAKRLASGK